MGDLNGRTVNRKDDPIAGPFGEDRCNYNREQLIDYCQTHDLPIHKFTWIQHAKKLGSIIDYIIIRHDDVRVYTGIYIIYYLRES